jgi:hypothetical protein
MDSIVIKCIILYKEVKEQLPFFSMPYKDDIRKHLFAKRQHVSQEKLGFDKTKGGAGND